MIVMPHSLLRISCLYGLMRSGRKRSSRDRSFNHPFDIFSPICTKSYTYTVFSTSSVEYLCSGFQSRHHYCKMYGVYDYNVYMVALAPIRLIANIYNVRP